MKKKYKSWKFIKNKILILYLLINGTLGKQIKISEEDMSKKKKTVQYSKQK